MAKSDRIETWGLALELCVVGTGKKKFGEGPTYEAAFDVARAAEKHAGCQRG